MPFINRRRSVAAFLDFNLLDKKLPRQNLLADARAKLPTLSPQSNQSLEKPTKNRKVEGPQKKTENVNDIDSSHKQRQEI